MWIAHRNDEYKPYLITIFFLSVNVTILFLLQPRILKYKYELCNFSEHVGNSILKILNKLLYEHNRKKHQNSYYKNLTFHNINKICL